MYSRLLALVGNQATVDATLKLARQDFSRPHGVKVGKLSTMAGSAEVWLLLGPSGKAEDVKFISGVESFRSLTKSIAGLKFQGDSSRRGLPPSSCAVECWCAWVETTAATSPCRIRAPVTANSAATWEVRLHSTLKQR